MGYKDTLAATTAANGPPAGGMGASPASGGAAPDSDPEQPARACLARGDARGTIRALSELYGDAVYSYCTRMMRDSVAAEDVLQQVFLEAHRDILRFEGRSQFKSWLLGIAHHRCLDALRAYARTSARLEEDDGALELVPHGGDDPLESVQRGRMKRALEGCLRRLSNDVRTTVLMRFHHGLSYEEMSAALGERPGTLQARVSRALPALRRCLEAKGMTL